MHESFSEAYHGWKITIGTESNMCSSYSFDITDPSGKTQHISMGGDTKGRARERAREMVDMEIELTEGK